jgi:hypothetical protein
MQRHYSIGGAAIVSAGAYPKTTILHVNVQPIEGANGLQFQVLKSTIYLQSRSLEI